MTVDFIKMRVNMVNNQLRAIGITDYPLLAIFGLVPREDFVDSKYRALAYSDKDLDFGPEFAAKLNRYMMNPCSLAKLLQNCLLKKQDRVLYIGGNTGYGPVIVSHLVDKVVAVEEDELLFKHFEQILANYSVSNLSRYCQKMSSGCKQCGPYDVILIEGAVDNLGQEIFDQLAEDGRLVYVAPACDKGYNNAAKIYKKKSGSVLEIASFDVSAKLLDVF